MRVAVIVVTMMVLTTPSTASPSCMNQAEARKHFVSAHLYWHGPNHCWDATAPRHRQIQARKSLIREAEVRGDRLKWQDSMSAMLPDDGPERSLRTPATLEIDRQADDDAVAGTPWADRWVDIRPAQSRLVARPVRVVQFSAVPVIEDKSTPMISRQNAVVLVFLTFMLALGTIVVLRRHEA
jgi:hypothetical protein